MASDPTKDYGRGGTAGAPSGGTTGPAAGTAARSGSGGPGAGGSRQGQGQTDKPSMLPAITTPKGGGAIRGIGEKFQVSAATGTASLSVPLPMSAGRGGFGPQVDLSYDSGHGNGPFGLGFALSVATITRKTDKGLPRYYDSEESDEYILSGAEDLVPNRKADGSLDVLSRPDRVVQQYRPRSEGLFARIERHTMAADGSVHWEVTTKDNVTHVYGRSNATTFQGRDLPCFAMNAIFQLHLQRLTWASSSKHFDAAYADFSVRGSREAPSVELPGRTEMNVGERSVSELPRLSERARSSWVTGSTSPIQTSQRATLSVVRTSPSCRRESCSPPAWAHRMRQWGSSTPTCTRRKFGGQRKAGESI